MGPYPEAFFQIHLCFNMPLTPSVINSQPRSRIRDVDGRQARISRRDLGFNRTLDLESTCQGSE
jgi:hypothetical protein